jgi:glutathione S-transferase
MTIRLYELAAAEDDRRFSPYCWRIRFALRHKQLDFETVGCRFADKDVIAFSGQERVPVLVDGDTVVSDSWAIACYLEQTYPDRPSLFGGPVGQALSRFYADWTDTSVHGVLIQLLATDIHANLHDKDKAYFRTSREKNFGMTLEEFCSDPNRALQELKRILTPLRRTLRNQAYLGGDAPLYADFAVMGAFMWARSMSSLSLLEEDDPIALWQTRLLARLDEGSMGLRAYR